MDGTFAVDVDVPQETVSDADYFFYLLCSI